MQQFRNVAYMHKVFVYEAFHCRLCLFNVKWSLFYLLQFKAQQKGLSRLRYEIEVSLLIFV